MLAKAHISSQRFSHTLLIKGILLHVLQGKSWRQAAAYIGVPYTILYQFYRTIEASNIIDSIVHYVIERRIALYVQDEKHITQELLESDFIVEETIAFYNS